jgi:hypothetical protein
MLDPEPHWPQHIPLDEIFAAKLHSVLNSGPPTASPLQSHSSKKRPQRAAAKAPPRKKVVRMNSVPPLQPGPPIDVKVGEEIEVTNDVLVSGWSMPMCMHADGDIIGLGTSRRRYTHRPVPL